LEGGEFEGEEDEDDGVDDEDEDEDEDPDDEARNGVNEWLVLVPCFLSPNQSLLYKLFHNTFSTVISCHL
jgi:hypothetical protein